MEYRRSKEAAKKREMEKIDFKPAKRTSIVPDYWPEVPKLEVWNVSDPHSKLPDGAFVILEGSRRSGKSIFLKWLLYHYREQFDVAVVMSETPHNGFWQPIVSNQYVHSGWNPFLVAKIMDDQIKEKEKEEKQRGYKAKQILIILDDIVGDRRRIHDDAVLNKLAVEGRHFNIWVMLTTQEPHAIGTGLRNNCDLCVVFQQKSRRGREAVCDDFLNLKLEFRWQAEALLRAYTNDHDCIVVQMNTLSPVAQKAYYYVPEDMTFDKKKDQIKVPDYQLGSADQRKLAQNPKGKIPLFESIDAFGSV